MPRIKIEHDIRDKDTGSKSLSFSQEEHGHSVRVSLTERRFDSPSVWIDIDIPIDEFKRLVEKLNLLVV